MNSTPNDHIAHGVAFVPATVGSSAVNGANIVRPWEVGRYLTFLISAGAMTTNDALTFTLQARRKGTSTYDTLKESDGTTNLTVTGADVSDGGALDQGSVFASLDISRFKAPNSAFEYDAIRLVAQNAVAQNVVVAATYIITSVFDGPVRNLDGALVSDLTLFRQLPHDLT